MKASFFPILFLYFIFVSCKAGHFRSLIQACSTYTVVNGDYCWKIANDRGLTVDQLTSFNPGLNCNTIQPGDVLCVSSGSKPSPQPSGSCSTYSVSSGDTCWKIANDHGISLDQLNSFNPGLNCDNLQIGDTVCVSAGVKPNNCPQPSGSSCSTYSVLAGDSCWQIINKFGVCLSTELLNEYNPGLDCNSIQVGQLLCVSKGDKPDIRPKPQGDNCFPYKVVSGDSCSSIAGKNGLTVQDIENFNSKTWRWQGCSNLQAGMKICLSTGNPPLPDIDPSVQCGLESPGNKTCPLNVCCSKWGWCGFSSEFCEKDPQNRPGLGCQTNCETSPPPEMKVCNNVMSKKIGYYAGWSETRACNTVSPKDIDPTLYTHIHYAFGVVDENLRINFPSNEDMDRFQRLVALKSINKDLKIILSIGGWSFQNPGPTVDRFKNMMASQESRDTFIASAIGLMSLLGFDGIDIDWEYPTTPERSGSPADTDNFLAFVKEARDKFGNTYSLSVAAPSGYWYLRNFRIAEMAQYLDYIVFMTYDLHGNWDYSIPSLGGWLNGHTNLTEIVDSINMMMKAGVPSNKIIMGLGYYGRSFVQEDPTCFNPGVCKFKNPGNIIPAIDNYEFTATPGMCTKTGGTLAYFEIVSILSLPLRFKQTYEKEAFVVVAYNQNDWVAFDDETTIQIKISKAKDLCLGGTVAWSIDQDYSQRLSTIVANKAPQPISFTDSSDALTCRSGNLYLDRALQFVYGSFPSASITPEAFATDTWTYLFNMNDELDKYAIAREYYDNLNKAATFQCFNYSGSGRYGQIYEYRSNSFYGCIAQYARYKLDFLVKLNSFNGFQQIINNQLFEINDIMTKLMPDAPEQQEGFIDKLSEKLKDIFTGISALILNKILPGAGDLLAPIVGALTPTNLLDKTKSEINKEWQESEAKDHQTFRDITQKTIGNLLSLALNSTKDYYRRSLCTGSIFQGEFEKIMTIGLKDYQDPTSEAFSNVLIKRYQAQWRITAALIFMSNYYYFGTTGNMDFCYCSYLAPDTFKLIYNGNICADGGYTCINFDEIIEIAVKRESSLYRPSKVKCFSAAETQDCVQKTVSRYQNFVNSKQDSEAWFYLDTWGVPYGHQTESVQGFFLRRLNDKCPKSNQYPTYNLDMHQVMSGTQYTYLKQLIAEFKSTYYPDEQILYKNEYLDLFYGSKAPFEKIKINAMSYWFGGDQNKDEWRFYVAACLPKQYCNVDRVQDDAFGCSESWFFETKSYPLCEQNCQTPPGGWFNL